MRNAILAFALLATAWSTAAAQSPGAELATGDREYRAMRAEEALAAYERALAADPDNYEALWKASRSALDLASGPVSSNDRRFQLFRTGERYARRAVALQPADAEGHFSLARALGKTSLSLGIRDKVKYATTIREQALECVRLNPAHSGCHHILGVWNAEVMRLSGFERMIARNFLGGRALGAASWANAVRHLEQAVKLSPDRIIHHLELGDVYRDRKDTAAARRSYETATRLPLADYNDERYKAQAEAGLRALP
ncbi:MAG TPA: tetratricopeptide repeat protein [Gemmatimonadaceae bacterium]|nr:tetratricopeptide repeat protein [Gemmatimonadaceae bacterium]